MSTAPEPVFFGPEDRSLAGWLYRTSDRTGSLGLILCNPFGYESICAHRTMRHVALSAAQAGFPALRFDYDGTGDSAGNDLDPDRVRAWINSVHVAIDSLRRDQNCSQVVVLGIRLGATLAALASAEREDVAGLVAIAPVVNVKTYLRELRALQMASASATAPTSQDASGADATEVTGYLIATSTRESLNAIDLLKTSRVPAPAMLILERNDLPGNDKWAAHLQKQGAHVERHTVPGYVEMMLSPHRSVVPQEMVWRTVEWLGTRASNLPLATQTELPRASTFRDCARITPDRETQHGSIESLEFLDKERRLFGVVTRPSGHSARGKNVLLLNAGATHHVGPNRMYVHLARTLASLGYVVLRMDLSGIGDSLPRPGEAENVVYSALASVDINDALRHMRERFGETRTHAVGLCSGAYHALKASVEGSALAGLIMINPLTFFWKEGMSLDPKESSTQHTLAEAGRYQKSVFRLQSWLKLLRGGVDLRNVGEIFFRRVSTTLRHTMRDLARGVGLPLKDDLGRDLEAVAKRGVDVRFVFAASDPGAELLRLEGGSVYQKLLRREKIDVQVIDGADHTFTHRRQREELLKKVSQALADDIPPPPNVVPTRQAS